MLHRERRGYLVIAIIFSCLMFLLIFGRMNFTGYAIFSSSGSDFNLGTYANTSYNGSGVVLAGTNLTGSYVSKVFDAGNDANWNNMSYVSGNQNIELIFAADNNADVWKSIDIGATWSLIKDDYNNGDGNEVTDMVRNSSKSLFILNRQDIWKSDDKGVSWTKINDDYNGAEGQNGFVLGIENNNLIIVEGDQDVWKSTDSGISWTKVSTDFNGGNGNIFGIAVNSSSVIFVVDGAADVWKSTDSGATWNLVKDDYNGANGNDANDMAINSSDALFILHNQDVWRSVDNGVTWSLANDDVNGAEDSNSGIVMYVDTSNNLYVIDGSEDVFKSTDSGTSFTKVVTDFNSGNLNVFGLTSAVYSTNLSFQVRNCSSSDCSDGSWQTKDMNSIGLTGRYFQYKTIFDSPDSSISSYLNNVSIDYNLINTAPSLSLASPQDGASYGYNNSLSLNFSVSDTDNNLQSCWYNIDNGANNSLSSCLNTTFSVSGSSSYVLNIFANDSLGLETNDSASFNVNIGSPTIILSSPIDVYLNSGVNIEFKYTPSDVDLDYCELWGNFNTSFSLNQTDLNPDNEIENIFTLSLSDNSYLWNIRCIDNAGHSAFNGNKSFYVDTIAPSLSLTQPIGTKTSRTSISLTFSSSDASPVSCKYNVTLSVGTLIVGSTNIENCSSTNFDVSSDGDYKLYLSINDSAGWFSFANSSFSVDTSTPVTPPSSGGGSSGGGGGSSLPVSNASGKLELSGVSNMIIKSGDKKTLSLSIKNAGFRFANNCKLITNGDASSWAYSKQIEGIAPGQKVDFVFDLNVPDSLNFGDYKLNLKVECDEARGEKNIVLSVVDLIKIKSIVQEKNSIEMYYLVNPRGLVGKSVTIDILISDGDNNDIQKTQDIFLVEGNETIERKIIMDIPRGLIGLYYVSLSPGFDSENIVKQQIILGEQRSFIGRIILGTTNSKGISYILFVLIICIAIFFIVRKSYKKEEYSEKSYNREKHSKTLHKHGFWFFRKKK